MNERIIQLRKFLQLNQKQFAEKIGLSQTGLSGIETGYSSITKQTLITICNVFNVNENWLKNGQGNMFNNIDKAFNEFFEIYNKLSKPLQEFLLTIAKELLNTQNKL